MSEGFVKNAADESQVKSAESKVARGRDRELDEFRSVMATYHGRSFVHRYITVCGVFEDGFTGNNTTFYNEGKRSIGLRLLADVNEASPEKYGIMLEEARIRNLKER